MILPKTHPDYRTENALFREMLEQYQPPAWAVHIIVLGDAGYGSKANINLVKKMDKADRSRSWHFQ
jgi:hypothetical protein